MNSVFPTTATAATVRPAPAGPPRIDLWPQAQQSAELSRGSLVRCGPGLRSVGWPETPRVRLTALAPWLKNGRVATHMTAAWVWGAIGTPRQQLQASTRVGRRGPTAISDRLRVYEMRFTETDTKQFGEFRVSTPLRTTLDLLYTPDCFGQPEMIACRLLMRMIQEGAEFVTTHVVEHRRPHSKTALQRLVAMTGRSVTRNGDQH